MFTVDLCELSVSLPKELDDWLLSVENSHLC